MTTLRRFGAFIGRPDVLRDLHIYGGLLVSGLGGWHISPAWTSILVGVALVAMGLLVPSKK